jgi:hypothetical protein
MCEKEKKQRPKAIYERLKQSYDGPKANSEKEKKQFKGKG